MSASSLERRVVTRRQLKGKSLLQSDEVEMMYVFWSGDSYVHPQLAPLLGICKVVTRGLHHGDGDTKTVSHRSSDPG